MSEAGKEKALQPQGIEEEPDEGRDAEADLESGLPFTTPVGRDDLALFNGDLTEARHQKLASQNDDYNPGRTVNVFVLTEKYESGGSQDLVGNRIEELA